MASEVYKNPILRPIENGYVVSFDCYGKSKGSDSYEGLSYLRNSEVYFKQDESELALAKLNEIASKTTFSNKVAGNTKK